MEIVKAGSTELTKDEALQIYYNNQYVCNYSGIYQPHYSQVQNQVYFSKVIYHTGYARKGRFYIQSAKQINHVFDKKILIENEV